MDERNVKIKELFSDAAFVGSLLEAENEQAVQKMLADKGLEMSIGEIELMGEMFEKSANGELNMEQLEKLANGGELSEDELSEAAGGNWFTDLFKENGLIQSGWQYLDSNGAWQLSPTKVEGAPNVPYMIEKVSTSTPRVVAGVAVGVIAAAGVAYGIYDAVRRRW